VTPHETYSAVSRSGNPTRGTPDHGGDQESWESDRPSVPTVYQGRFDAAPLHAAVQCRISKGIRYLRLSAPCAFSGSKSDPSTPNQGEAHGRPDDATELSLPDADEVGPTVDLAPGPPVLPHA